MTLGNKVQEEGAHNNVELAYEYTKEELENASKSLTGLQGRLVAVLSAAGVLAKFVSDLEGNRVGLCLLIGMTVGLCLLGLGARGVGRNVPPEDLLYKEWYYESEENCRLYIARSWNESLKEVDSLRDWRSGCVNSAVICLGLSLLFYLAIVGWE